MSASDWAKRAAAFPNADASLGCIDTADSNTNPGPCVGGELAAHLDFDTDGDGSTYAGAGNTATADRGDAYFNRGAGWLPIGNNSAGFAAMFKGGDAGIAASYSTGAVASTGDNVGGLGDRFFWEAELR